MCSRTLQSILNASSAMRWLMRSIGYISPLRPYSSLIWRRSSPWTSRRNSMHSRIWIRSSWRRTSLYRISCSCTRSTSRTRSNWCARWRRPYRPRIRRCSSCQSLWTASGRLTCTSRSSSRGSTSLSYWRNWPSKSITRWMRVQYRWCMIGC